MDTISFDDFKKIEMRTGMILSIDSIPKSKKLVKLQVDFGESGERTIVAGIAQAVADGRAIVGQRVVAVLNLEPREMFGITSHGMLLASLDTDGNVWLVNPSSPGKNGELVG